MKRSAMVGTAVAMAVIVASMFFIPVTNAATIKATYQGVYGSNGTISVRQFTDGTGSAIINMHALTRGRTYAFSLNSGTCAVTTTRLIPAKTITVSSAGKISHTWPLSISQMRTIGPRLSSAKVVALLTSGSSRLCRTLKVLKAAAPTPSPTAAPNVSTHQFGYGPTLTAASMSDWLPALKVGVATTATATVAAGQNVYALLVIPAGGSIAFTITTNSGNGGWYWQWDSVANTWQTPVQYFSEGQFFARSSGTWAFGLDSNTYAGSETLTIKPTAITRP